VKAGRPVLPAIFCHLLRPTDRLCSERRSPRHYWRVCLRHRKSRSRRRFATQRRRLVANAAPQKTGSRPSFRSCWVQSGLGSRSRSILMPRGRRPSTAAFTSVDARNASESVRLTCRIEHRSRFANCSPSLTAPVTSSSSHLRLRAIAETRRARRSARSGRVCSLTTPCGSRISRLRFDGGFCQETCRVIASVDRSVSFNDMTSLLFSTSIPETREAST